MFPGIGISENSPNRVRPMDTGNGSVSTFGFLCSGARSISLSLWPVPLILWILVFSTGVARGQAISEAEEYPAKAAFLYNICKFVTWPEKSPVNQDSEFVIAVLGKTPLLAALQSIDGKRIGGKPIKTLSVSNIDDISSARVLCFSMAELRRLSKEQRDRLAGLHVLTVGETDEFVDAGGIVAMTVAQERLVFSINLAASRRAGLEMSAALLSLAQKVVDQ